MLFVDKAKIKIRAGQGGNGGMSFRREKYVPRGGPDGGDGGNGGSVIFECTHNEQSLIDLKYMNHYEAENGHGGMGKGKHGRNGSDIIIKVPSGTVIRDIGRDMVEVADLSVEGEQFVAARGGKGGRGNARFLSSTNQAPRIFEEGKEGEEFHLELELKTIADAGFVGYPNAGKSTLLAAVSNARPATGAYPFTTVTPSVGIVQFDDYEERPRLTIADIPGLVEGAHMNVGLGHDFLRHIERTRVLIYVLDVAGIDGRTPWDDLAALKKELELYQEGLSRRTSFIVANKMDEVAATENLAKLKTKTDLLIFPVCALLEDGTRPLLAHLRELLIKEERGGV